MKIDKSNSHFHEAWYNSIWYEYSQFGDGSLKAIIITDIKIDTNGGHTHIHAKSLYKRHAN